jgi:choline dehydrogenase-like flavoprotein
MPQKVYDVIVVGSGATGGMAAKEVSHGPTSVPGILIHEVGPARMGDDPKKSVLNKFNQAWDVKNLFVIDGACYVSRGNQNPTPTMMAIAARAMNYLAEELRTGGL